MFSCKGHYHPQASHDSQVQYISRIIHNIQAVCVVSYGLALTNFTYVPQGFFTGTGAIMWLPQCQWSNPEVYS